MAEETRDLSGLAIDRDRPSPGPIRALRWAVVLAVATAGFLAVLFFLNRGPGGVPVTLAFAEAAGGSAGATTGITASGYVVARTQASVSSKISGRLEYLGVEEGSVVLKGEVMARLENRDYQAAVRQAEAEHGRALAALREAQAQRRQAELDLERARQLVERDFETQETVDLLATQLEATEARVAVQEATVTSAEAGIGFARANLENTLIRAPFDGTILRKDAEVGEVVAPVATGGGLTRGAVVTMADLETLEVEVDVNEAYIAQVRSGQDARIFLDAYPEASFQGRVRQIVPTADRQRATVQVKVGILDKDPRILTEMGARVEFLVAPDASQDMETSRIFVPAEAVRDEAGQAIVWVVRGGAAFRVVVDAGPVTGGRRVINSGLTGGEQVVISADGELADGVAVSSIAEQSGG
ncbi:MAG: efflux RND transporter periplasmic adaptor subunit [Gemmatimonadota bacterium]|nr:efflux RND transporter periplasmic adaptor subunit [Gemmatimonadota bacterium]